MRRTQQEKLLPVWRRYDNNEVALFYGITQIIHYHCLLTIGDIWCNMEHERGRVCKHETSDDLIPVKCAV